MGFDPSPGGLWFAQKTGVFAGLGADGWQAAIPKEKKSYAGVDHSSNEGIWGAQAAPDSRAKLFFCRQLHAMRYAAGVIICEFPYFSRLYWKELVSLVLDMTASQVLLEEIVPALAWCCRRHCRSKEVRLGDHSRHGLGQEGWQLGSAWTAKIRACIYNYMHITYTNIIKYYIIHTIFSMRCSMAVSVYLTYQVGLKIPDVESVSSSMLLVHWSADPSNPSCRGSFCDKQILTSVCLKATVYPKIRRFIGIRNFPIRVTFWLKWAFLRACVERMMRMA